MAGDEHLNATPGIKISCTFTAQQHIAREKAWWFDNRDHVDVFAQELEEALKIVATLPGAGTV